MNMTKIVEEQLLKMAKVVTNNTNYENHDFNDQINSIENADTRKIFEVIKLNGSLGVTERCLSDEIIEVDEQQQTVNVADSQHVIFISDNGNQPHIRFSDEQQHILKFSSYMDFKRALAEYETQTITKFILRNQSKQFTAPVCLHDILRNEKNSSDLPMIRWEFCAAKDFLPIPFMGIPYITVGKQVFQCHQGKDYNTNKKQQYELKKEILNQATRFQIKSRNKGHSKKLDCPVLFAVRKLYFFPEYPLETDTKRNRALIAQNLRARLAKIKLEKCICLKSNEHYENLSLSDIPGKLEFLTRFPQNNEHNHSVAKAASFIKLQMKKLGSKSTENIALKKTAEVNPFQYDKHVELITALRQSGDLDQLRTARENMANVYPLTEAMWLDWFHDELPLAMLQEQKEYLLEKFDLAVKDYTSVKVWHEYCQFVMNNIESPADIERARIVFERAITAVGLHVVEGSSIWDGYREFEMAILDSYQQLHESGDTIGMDAKVDMQIERISSLFKRQLSVPLMGMSETFKIFEDWLTEAIPSEVHRSYDRALQKLSLCMEYEEKLTSSVDSSFPSTNLPSLNEYLNYINYEMKDGDPARIQSIFERAIKDHCLQHELWIKYLNYLDYKLKIPDIALAAHVRSVRNCPWVSPLWVKYLNALERSNKDYSEIKDVFNQSLKGGFSGAPSYLQIWLADCDYHRRRAVDSSFDNEKVEDLRKSFEGAITYMNQYFGLEGDKNCILLREWAFIEAKYLNNAKRGQELWDTVMKKHSKDINMWLEYIHYLMLFADVPTIRRVFQRIIQISFDQPEQILEAFITFERQHGSLAELDDAQQKVDAQLIKIKEKREKEVFNPQPEKSVKKDQQKPNKKKKVKKEKSYLKRSNDESMEIESPLKRKKEEMKMESIDEVKTNKDDFTCVTVQTQAAFAKTEFTDIERSSSLPSPLNVNDKDQVVLNNGEQVRKVDNDASIFISNLLFSVDENHIKEKFEKFGEIETIRVVKNRAGKSKGYAYLQFKSKSSVDSSLLLDRESILGRPMFVSKCVDKQHNPTKFKFPTQLDKHTLYVSNLPFEMTAEEVTEHFAKIGKLKQVRLVTNRSGKSKGYAYVEYESEIDAQSAIVKLDQIPLHDRPINVALSNPPARKINVAHEDKFKVPSKEPGVRGRSKTQISMVPRSLQKSSSSEVSNNPSTLQELKGNDATIKDKGPAVAMNNEEFRQFLLKH